MGTLDMWQADEVATPCEADNLLADHLEEKVVSCMGTVFHRPSPMLMRGKHPL